jgi:ppGpp synthetase/RelA/SpoT-type nucleotidyltranferase
MSASNNSGRVSMDYVIPLYAQDEIDLAGRFIADGFKANPEGKDWALNVFNNWRASYNYPLNGLSVVLKQRARRVSLDPVISQRLKRIESVERKLSKRPDISLTSMQDMGGCRSIVETVDEVYKLREQYFSGRRSTHEFKTENDYIKHPKKDGYRGIHLVYYFVGSTGRAEVYAARRMQIEIQMRTLLQHYWATAVETAETFTRQPMKSQKDDNVTPWRQFFALVSSCFAHQEGCALIPKMTKDINQIRANLKEIEQQYRFCDTLDAYKITASQITSRNKARYFLVNLDLETREVQMKGFKSAESEEGSEAYGLVEQASLLQEGAAQQVLVSVDDVSQLRRAYPNYFLDTAEFVARVRALVA